MLGPSLSLMNDQMRVFEEPEEKILILILFTTLHADCRTTYIRLQRMMSFSELIRKLIILSCFFNL